MGAIPNYFPVMLDLIQHLIFHDCIPILVFLFSFCGYLSKCRPPTLLWTYKSVKNFIFIIIKREGRELPSSIYSIPLPCYREHAHHQSSLSPYNTLEVTYRDGPQLPFEDRLVMDRLGISLVMYHLPV